MTAPADSANAERLAKLAEVIEYLRGSCRSVAEAEFAFDMEGLEDATDFCQALDDELFMCEGCGWWCERSEEREQGKCEDCREQEEEED